jgi:hypothetical protein
MVVVSALAVLTGCGTTSSGVQYDKGATAVSTFTHTSLTVPPEFGLRPPIAGRAVDTTKKKTLPWDHYSAGTVALLRGAKADQSLPDVRAVIDRDFSALTTESSAFIDRLVLLAAPDPQTETRNPESGVVPLPVIQRGKKKGWLFGLF